MRAVLSLTLTLLLVVSSSYAGLVQRRFRNVQETPAVAVLTSEPVAADLRKDQIPVTVIELQEPQAVEQQPIQNERRIDTAAEDIVAPEIETLKNAASTADIAEDIAQAVEQDQKLRAVDAVVEAERQQTTKTAELQQTTQQATEQSVATLVNSETLTPTVDAEETAAPELSLLKAVPNDDTVIVEQPAEVHEHIAQPADAAVDTASNVRQATQATPTTTQQNFVQQLQNTIQNSPIGQFLNQITGQQQTNGQPSADEPATPNPTIPGFLNPAVAITNAQQAVQNAAQSVVNTTTQAFQGLQQFANNLGTQFQNTLSNLGGQQNQLTTSDSTTTRPPGPFQAIVNTFTGGINNNNQPAEPAPGQPQGPLQGIISFFQGGARPTTAPAANAVQTSTGPAIVEAAQVDDKIDETSNDDTAQEPDSNNEVRNSEEVAEDSFEEAQQSDLIVVNDDNNQQDVVAA